MTIFNKHILFIILLVCLPTLVCLPIRAEKISKNFIVSYGANDAPPYAITEKGQLSQGIIKDIFDRIANELKISITYVNVPRKRAELYLKSGKINAIAISNPEWLKNSHQYQWSIPILAEQDRLVTLTLNSKIKSHKNITSIDDMRGMLIGTTRGYIYPKLSKYFAQKLIYRYDVNTIDANFKRLLLGRIDAFIDANILIDYYLTQHFTDKSKRAQFTIEPVLISQHFVHTAISANSPVSAKQFNQALAHLKKIGFIQSVLNKYGIRN